MPFICHEGHGVNLMNGGAESLVEAEELEKGFQFYTALSIEHKSELFIDYATNNNSEILKRIFTYQLVNGNSPDKNVPIDIVAQAFQIACQLGYTKTVQTILDFAGVSLRLTAKDMYLFAAYGAIDGGYKEIVYQFFTHHKAEVFKNNIIVFLINKAETSNQLSFLAEAVFNNDNTEIQEDILKGICSLLNEHDESISHDVIVNFIKLALEKCKIPAERRAAFAVTTTEQSLEEVTAAMKSDRKDIISQFFNHKRARSLQDYQLACLINNAFHLKKIQLFGDAFYDEIPFDLQTRRLETIYRISKNKDHKDPVHHSAFFQLIKLGFEKSNFDKGLQGIANKILTDIAKRNEIDKAKQEEDLEFVDIVFRLTDVETRAIACDLSAACGNESVCIKIIELSGLLESDPTPSTENKDESQSNSDKFEAKPPNYQSTSLTIELLLIETKAILEEITSGVKEYFSSLRKSILKSQSIGILLEPFKAFIRKIFQDPYVDNLDQLAIGTQIIGFLKDEKKIDFLEKTVKAKYLENIIIDPSVSRISQLLGFMTQKNTAANVQDISLDEYEIISMFSNLSALFELIEAAFSIPDTVDSLKALNVVKIVEDISQDEKADNGLIRLVNLLEDVVHQILNNKQITTQLINFANEHLNPPDISQESKKWYYDFVDKVLSTLSLHLEVNRLNALDSIRVFQENLFHDIRKSKLFKAICNDPKLSQIIFNYMHIIGDLPIYKAYKNRSVQITISLDAIESDLIEAQNKHQFALSKASSSSSILPQFNLLEGQQDNMQKATPLPTLPAANEKPQP